MKFRNLYFLIIILYSNNFLANEGILVSTSSGEVKSKLIKKVQIWEDIPYAQPPVGDLRWKAPKKILKNSNLIKPKNDNFCIQRTSYLGGTSQYTDDLISGTEDCLYLDIYAPKKKSKDLLPVMFWIHGGGNTSGLKDIYDFSKFVAKHNVIVVAINYRLGPLGWFTHPSIQGLQDGIDKASNFGTLDIISALEWVNENISLFGGNSKNITIFGESAGGHNVLSLLVSKKAKGLFHKAISMSGYTESISPEDAYRQNKQSPTSNYSTWEVVNKILMSQSDKNLQDKHTLEELKNILYSLSGKEFYQFYAERENFEELPLLTNDGIVIPKIGLKKALSKEEYINNVPTIAGSTRDEVKIWLAFSEYFVTVDYSLSGSIFGLPQVILNDEDAFEAFNYYRSNAWKIRGVNDPLNSLAQAGNSKLYSYRVDWDDRRKFLVADFKKLFGAGHALEILLLTGSTKLVGGPPVSNFMYPKGISRFYTSKNMMKFWSNFAKYGEPGYSSNNVKWEPYSFNENNTSNYMVIDKKKNLKMSSDDLTLLKLSQQVFKDSRLDEVEKCVVLYQIFTYVGDDVYEENIKNYPGKCDRKTSENFIINNAGVIDYD
jgi:para-nitrobenzyl esterase